MGNFETNTQNGSDRKSIENQKYEKLIARLNTEATKRKHKLKNIAKWRSEI